jgi:hypothetical protein
LSEDAPERSFEVEISVLVKISASLACVSVAILLLAGCFRGGGSEASASQATNALTPSASTASTTTAATPTGSQSTEPATVTGLADVPTATETVGTDALPKSAPPWKKKLSVCKTRSFRVVYDRDIPAILVLQGDQVLAWAGLYRRDVSDECGDVPRKPPTSTSNEPPPEGIYDSVRLRCTAPGLVQIDAHAIEMSGSVYGSQIYVTVAGSTEWLISAVAVEDVEGRRVYANERYCSRS